MLVNNCNYSWHHLLSTIHVCLCAQNSSKIARFIITIQCQQVNRGWLSTTWVNNHNFTTKIILVIVIVIVIKYHYVRLKLADLVALSLSVCFDFITNFLDRVFRENGLRWSLDCLSTRPRNLYYRVI